MSCPPFIERHSSWSKYPGIFLSGSVWFQHLEASLWAQSDPSVLICFLFQLQAVSEEQLQALQSQNKQFLGDASHCRSSIYIYFFIFNKYTQRSKTGKRSHHSSEGTVSTSFHYVSSWLRFLKARSAYSWISRSVHAIGFSEYERPKMPEWQCWKPDEQNCRSSSYLKLVQVARSEFEIRVLLFLHGLGL